MTTGKAVLVVIAAVVGLGAATPGNGQSIRRRPRDDSPRPVSTRPEMAADIESKVTVHSLSQSARQDVDSIIDKFMSANQIPGLELSIQQDGQTIYECGYGTIEKGSKIVPGPNTKFQIDSLTKVFTAFAVLRLAEEGRVDIDEKIGKYMSLPNEKWESIPIRQYLGMVTGIPDGGTTTGSYKNVIDSVAVQKTSYGVGLDFEPGSRYEYSNPNFFILGDLVAAVTHKGYMAYTRGTVLNPFGMTGTGFLRFQTGDLWPTPYQNGKPVAPRQPQSGFSGGGFVSSMNDLEKFGIGLYNRWVLGAKSYKEMWTRTVLTSGSDKGESVGFGMGWDVARDDPRNVSKLGGGWGWTSFLRFYPQSGDSVILLCNTDASGIGQVASNIEKAVAGKERIGR